MNLQETLTACREASTAAMRALVAELPRGEQKRIELLLNQGFRLRLAVDVGLDPDLTLALVNDLEHAEIIFSLALGRLPGPVELH
jgi:hypothetical protein